MSMQIFQIGSTEESKKSWAWWNALEGQWKMAFNEAAFGKGPILAPPKDEELVLLLTRANVLRFVGPLGINPSMSFQVTNLSGLEGLKHLVSLTVNFCKLDNLEPLRTHFRLKALFVNNNKLTSLKGLENLLQLQELYANVNEITNLQPLENLTNLNTLYVNYNKLTSVAGISVAHAQNLRHFYVEPNEGIPHTEFVKMQMNYGILCRKG